ncbi:hypothetical protein [Halorussus aquaticus]|uniref:Uncharacterized protein n=1 Tax=Halorussus aquaticus TaxID=2953748 RepID=A0ABD5Q2P1_9EURY|nr:hypothetical protein [Halorussus aquaticus]
MTRPPDPRLQGAMQKAPEQVFAVSRVSDSSAAASSGERSSV